MPTFKELRERAMLSQNELARLCAVTSATVYYWESGRTLPRLAQQRKLVEALKCTPDELRAALQATQERRKQRADDERPAA